MGFSKKFKKGDKVRVIKPKDPRYKQIGKIVDYYSSYCSGGIYGVKFENGTRSYYPNELEKVEDSSNTDTKSNKLSISDLRPGMKVRIRSDLKEYLSKYMYVNDTISSYSGTVHTIKEINSNNYILLNDIPNTWSIENFSEIVEDNKKENKSFSRSLTISDFKVGMRVRVKEDFDKIATGPYYISNISTKMRTFKGKELVIENIGNNYIIAKNYCWLPEWLEIIDESTNSLNSVKNSSVKEPGIITKVNFTLTDFKSEKLEHSKFTIL